MIALDTLLYPELDGFAPGTREAALKRARAMPLAWEELAGLGLGVVALALATRFGAVGLLVALPLLAAVAGLFLRQRTRRALRQQLRARAPAGDPVA